MEKITAQTIHDALNQALSEMGKEAQEVVGIRPKPAEELSEDERAVINQMTLSTNCILSEFTDH